MTDTTTPETLDDIDFGAMFSAPEEAPPEPEIEEEPDTDDEPAVESETSEGDDDSEESEPEPEPEDARRLMLRVKHRDVEFDPWEDEARTVDLVQKGMDYDRQRELADKARAEVERHQQVTSNIMSELQRRGVVQQSPTGQWQWTQFTPGDPEPQTDELAELKAAALRENDPESWDRYTEALAEHKAKAVVDARFSEMEKQRELAERERTDAASRQQTEATWKAADDELSSRVDRLKNCYVDPHTKQVDERLVELELYRAKQELRKLVAGNDTEAWDKVLGDLERRAKAHQASQLERLKALPKRRLPRKSAPPAPSGGAPSPTPKRKGPETIDDIDPLSWATRRR